MRALDPPRNACRELWRHCGPLGELWEALEELWEGLGVVLEELWGGLGELWESFGRVSGSSGTSLRGSIYQKTCSEYVKFICVFLLCNFQEKRPAGGRMAPETRTFTKTDVIFQKNDPPEAR